MLCMPGLIGQKVTNFNYAGDFTQNGDDIYLEFNLGTKLILSHIFTIPFCILEDGYLKRVENWIKPLDHWNDLFIGLALKKYDLDLYENNIYLEFSKLAILSNKNLISVYGSPCF